jgi:hypothetical protein
MVLDERREERQSYASQAIACANQQQQQQISENKAES